MAESDLIEEFLNSRAQKEHSFYEVVDPAFPDELLAVEKKHTQKVTKFKVAVLYIRPGQTEMPQVFANQPPPESGFWRLLESVAEKVSLKGWTKYRGDFGSDASDTSYYTEWKVRLMPPHATTHLSSPQVSSPQVTSASLRLLLSLLLRALP